MEMTAVYRGNKNGSGKPDYIKTQGEIYIPEKSATRSARRLAALMVGAGMLIGGLGVGATYRMAEREAAQSQQTSAESNGLEFTCGQLAQKDVTVRGADGKVSRLICDINDEVPHLVERK